MLLCHVTHNHDDINMQYKCSALTPVISPATALDEWDAAYVLTCATVTCSYSSKEGAANEQQQQQQQQQQQSIGSSRQVCRFTPRCIKDSDETVYCTSAPSGATNGTIGEFRIGYL